MSKVVGASSHMAVVAARPRQPLVAPPCRRSPPQPQPRHGQRRQHCGRLPTLPDGSIEALQPSQVAPDSAASDQPSSGSSTSSGNGSSSGGSNGASNGNGSSNGAQRVSWAGAAAAAQAAQEQPHKREKQQQQEERRQHQKKQLPPLVEQLLSSPSLERPEGTDPKQLLRVMDAFWSAMKEPQGKAVAAPTVVKRLKGSRLEAPPQYDVAVAGGTLGILLALALQMRGHRVVVIERRRLQGRDQEWNIGSGELQRLVECGLLTQQELDACVVSQFGPVRVGFKDFPPLDCGPGILDCGVSPRLLLETLRRRFLEAGGELLEHTAFIAAAVADDGVQIELLPGRVAAPGVQPGDVNRPMAMEGGVRAGDEAKGIDGGDFKNGVASNQPWRHQQGREHLISSSGNDSSSRSISSNRSADAEKRQYSGWSDGSSSGTREVVQSSRPRPRSLTARLLVDCMGHYSPVVRQMRGGTSSHPDGVVLVVGGCWGGFPPEKNISADLLATFTDAADDQQLLWEAFPAAGGTGRTMYMFQYTDAHPSRPSFAQLLDTYLRLLPQYQGVALDQLQPQRILMGGFPCYQDSPLRPGWDRVLQVGDAAAQHSPLSFGGFGSMVRHLPRLSAGISEALQEDRLSRSDLSWLQPYQPSLSAAFLLQRAMAPRPGQLAATAQPQQQRQGGGEAHQQQQERQLQGRAGQEQGRSSGAALSSVSKVLETSRSSSSWLGRIWQLPPDHVNRLLRCNFSVLRALGAAALRPFLQDTLRFGPLALTMLGMMLRDPICICRVLLQLGPRVLLSWAGHYFALAAYTLGHALLSPLRPLLKGSWHYRRLMDALEYGSGADGSRHSTPQGTAT